MKRLLFATLFFAVTVCGCSSASTVIFGKKTPIEKYEEKLEATGLQKTPEGRQWLAVSDVALQHPVSIQLPHVQNGNFLQNKPQALGLQFDAKRGEKLSFDLSKSAGTDFVLYAGLYQVKADGQRELLLSPDTNTTEFDYTVTEAGAYLLKLQPQLFRTGDYKLTIGSGPSLLFPVGDKRAYIGSVWGDDRDAGKRRHEGVDIFAAKKTPAVAAADGVIANVREGGIGGKTIWLRTLHQQVTLYYAHLDEQLVQEGQAVKAGDTIGLVGNTGNAKNTPSHLHFGVYGFGGAVDPYPFVNRQTKGTPAALKKMVAQVRLQRDYAVADTVLKKQTLLQPIAVTPSAYIAELANGRMVSLPFTLVLPVPTAKKPA